MDGCQLDDEEEAVVELEAAERADDSAVADDAQWEWQGACS
jgi:hypothetical protein